MTERERIEALCRVGASEEDFGALLAYTENGFLRRGGDDWDDGFFVLFEWPGFWDRARGICGERIDCEIFDSVAGGVPVIFCYSDGDFEALVREFVYKDREVPKSMGASFVHGKTARFIILSNKPYSGLPASVVGLSDDEWREKSLVIRKYHECAHYYTKRVFGVSRNNLHDELIADFCGLYAAFGEYRADWFVKFFDTRREIYTATLGAAAASIIKLAEIAAQGVEQWTKTDQFASLTESERIEALAAKELLSYAIPNRQTKSSEIAGGQALEQA